MSFDVPLWNAVLAGLEAKRETLDQQIKEIQALMGQRSRLMRGAADQQVQANGVYQRKLSAATRARMAKAQRERWARIRSGVKQK
jgi:hypothetical protein